VILAGDRVRGVRLAGGEELAARSVVAACDPVAALTRFVAPERLPERVAERVATIPSENGGTAYFTVHMAFSGRLTLSRLQALRDDDVDLRRTALLAGGFEDMVAAVDAATAGRLPDPFPVAALVPTGPDPTQAPDGQDTLYLWSGWAPREPAGGWERLAGSAAEALIEHAGHYYEGQRELEIGRFVEPWEVLAQRTRVPNGNPYYVDLLLSRSGPLRPALGLGGYATPIAGLFLTGGGTHPGPAVSGIPGRLAARKVLRALGGPRPRRATLPTSELQRVPA
jgi:phytoene dehydrogenase-like protein